MTISSTSVASLCSSRTSGASFADNFNASSPCWIYFNIQRSLPSRDVLPNGIRPPLSFLAPALSWRGARPAKSGCASNTRNGVQPRLGKGGHDEEPIGDASLKRHGNRRDRHGGPIPGGEQPRSILAKYPRWD